MEHVSLQSLIDYTEDALTTVERGKVDDHLAECAICQQTLTSVARTIAALTSPALVTPDSNLISRAVAAFRRKRQRPKPLPRKSTLLQFDSIQQGVPLGVRGAGQDRQMLYLVADFELDLQISPQSEQQRYSIQGQVLPTAVADTELEGIELRFYDEQAVIGRVITDSLGRFGFSDISAGKYKLQVVFDDYDTLIDPIEVA